MLITILLIILGFVLLAGAITGFILLADYLDPEKPLQRFFFILAFIGLIGFSVLGVIGFSFLIIL